ncbi:MAG: protein translocase subunit SecD, partial [bacterium]|nr:protein translocase subunit SecD [bacterium]
MWKIIKKIILVLIILIVAGGIGLFVYKSEYKINPNFGAEKAFFQKHQFRLGLDLSGGSHLIYKADVSALPSGEVSDSMEALRDVIERRVNLFGVSEPVVQVQDGGFISGAGEQLIVDLPGVTDVERAIAMIGQTPLLEFKIEADTSKPQELKVDANGVATLDIDSKYVATELTGRYLDKAILEFDQNTREPRV